MPLGLSPPLITNHPLLYPTPPGVLAGHLSDKSGASATVATSFTLLSVPCLYLYRTVGYTSMAANVALMMLSGFFVNGPYALITTAVSADLGTHDSLQVGRSGRPAAAP